MKKKKTIVIAINCNEAVARFNDFMDNFLKGTAMKELINHISECQHCMERFEFEQILKSKVGQLSKNEKNNALIKRVEKLIASV